MIKLCARDAEFTARLVGEEFPRTHTTKSTRSMASPATTDSAPAATHPLVNEGRATNWKRRCTPGGPTDEWYARTAPASIACMPSTNAMLEKNTGCQRSDPTSTPAGAMKPRICKLIPSVSNVSPGPMSSRSGASRRINCR